MCCFAAVVDETTVVVNDVADDQLGNPSPCEGWTVRDVINHITGGATMFAISAEQGSVPDEELGRLMGGDNLGDDPQGAWCAMDGLAVIVADRRAVEECAMTWIAVLLVGVAVTDLSHSIRPAPILNECTGAVVAVWLGLVAGLTALEDVVALAVIAALVVLWGQTVTRAFGRGRAWVPLLVLGASLVLGFLTSGWAGTADGLLGEWLDSVQVPALQGMSADRALLLAAPLELVPLSTGNVVVRLVLAATGTTNPTYGSEPDPDPEPRLKGGRLLGPMERVFIVGLGLSGYLTAASIVIAAKGLLRFPAAVEA